MAVEAAETNIDLGCSRLRERGSAEPGTAAAAAAQVVEQEYDRLLREPVDVTVSVKTLYPSPSAAAAGCGDGDRAPERVNGEGRGRRGEGAEGEEVPPSEGLSSRRGSDACGGGGGGPAATAATATGDEEEEAARGAEEAEQEEKMMAVRVEVPRLLRLALSADARATLARCVGGNILAAGFHGEASENFPLRAAPAARPQEKEDEEEEGGGDAATNRGGAVEEESEADDMEYERERLPGGRAQAGNPVAGAGRETGEGGLREGGAASGAAEAAAAGRAAASVPAHGGGDAAQHQHRRGHQPQSSPSAARRSVDAATAVESRGGEEAGARRPPSACPLCADPFDELLARHECAWCGGTVCRKCMHTQVSFLSVALLLKLANALCPRTDYVGSFKCK